MSEKHRTRLNVGKVVALSISWQRENLLARGLGLEHLRELLLGLARPLLRTGASLAYGGHWREEEEGNFTYELLRLISAEQEDKSADGPDSQQPIGLLYNHCAWPHYLAITPRIEAQWINCCRIVRITQKQAGIAAADIVADAEAASATARARFNAAVCLSAMRRLAMSPMQIEVPDSPSLSIPAVEARILLGGKVDGFSGFMPGLFEEALVSLQAHKPLFILGGFGGAAQVLAQGILRLAGEKPPELQLDWHCKHTPAFCQFLDAIQGFDRPPGCLAVEAGFQELADRLQAVQASPGLQLNTGLSDEETCHLMTTSDPHKAVKLVRQGLINLGMLTPGPD